MRGPSAPPNQRRAHCESVKSPKARRNLADEIPPAHVGRPSACSARAVFLRSVHVAPPPRSRHLAHRWTSPLNPGDHTLGFGWTAERPGSGVPTPHVPPAQKGERPGVPGVWPRPRNRPISPNPRTPPGLPHGPRVRPSRSPLLADRSPQSPSRFRPGPVPFLRFGVWTPRPPRLQTSTLGTPSWLGLGLGLGHRFRASIG